MSKDEARSVTDTSSLRGTPISALGPESSPTIPAVPLAKSVIRLIGRLLADVVGDTPSTVHKRSGGDPNQF